MELYYVYDNRTDALIDFGNWDEVQDYVENEGRYRVALVVYL